VVHDSADDAVKTLKRSGVPYRKAWIRIRRWEKFTDHFDTVHEGLLKRLKTQYPDLNSSTLKLCR
jgi:hypothetical protein